MGLYDEQIKQRIENDDLAFEKAFTSMASVVMGRELLDRLKDDRAKTKDAIDQILRFYSVETRELPPEICDITDQLEFLLRPSGIMRRRVLLKGTWYKDAIGALLVTTMDGRVVALLPDTISGYSYIDEAGNRVKLNKKTVTNISEDAICFYAPLPLKKLGIMDLLKYAAKALNKSDYAIIFIMTLIVSLLGMFSPYLNKQLYSVVVPSGDTSLMFPIAFLFIGVSISSLLIGITKNLVMSSVQTKLDIAVSAASMMRVQSLPASFFKKYSAGELTSRVQGVNSLCVMLVNVFLTMGLTSLFSLMYLGQIFAYSPALVTPSLLIIAGTVLWSMISTLIQISITKRALESEAKLNGVKYALFSGIQKIKLAGAEKRAFAKWASAYRPSAELAYNPPWYIKISGTITSAISLFGMIAIYYFAAVSKTDVAGYMAYTVSYGMVMGTFMSLSGLVGTFANIKPTLDLVKPILDTVPEISAGKKVITRLSGSIEMNNVTFRYGENLPAVVDDMSLRIRSGQYVAIVGKTGCGKSTLMRLLLGLEQTQKGAIYYDRYEIGSVELKSLRQKIGTVMQNGKLFMGDIYSNIVITAPQLTIDDAWEAAELSGIAEDIRAMPMGMHTVISEGGGGVSGGQRQRLMIARAIAPKPKF